MSSANSFNLEASKICRFGKGKLTSISQFVPILYSSSTNVLNLSKTICEFVVWERVNMKKLNPVQRSTILDLLLKQKVFEHDNLTLSQTSLGFYVSTV